MDELLARLQADSPAVAAIITVVALGILEWILGIVDAIRNSLFDLKYLDVWVRVQLLGRILPIVLVLAFSQVVGTISIAGVDLNVLYVAGLGAATAYGLTTIKSIADSLNPNVVDTTPTE